MEKFKFKSKAQTLLQLYKFGIINIPKTYVFTVQDFNHNSQKILKNIQNKFSKKIAIRSSNVFEDNATASFAGKFESILNIKSKDIYLVKKSINKVINSYKNFKNLGNEILVQSMIENVTLSGVCTTCDLENYFPFYQINYSVGKDTTIVTSGKSKTKNITFLDNNKFKVEDKKFRKLIIIIKRLKKKFGDFHLDIEFAINNKGKIYILQVRPIIIKKNISINENIAKFNFKTLEKKIQKLQSKHHDLLGKSTYFGVMPDWNPAEMIGTKPKPLALSLYQELITDNVWAEHRKNYGYRDVNSNHLMTTFFGTPFIDVRVDFNSWLPASLSTKTSEKLINYYLKKFKKNKNLHDKVEFEILFTCFTHDTKQRLKNLLKKGFNKKELTEIETSLKNINLKAIEQMNLEIKKINILKERKKQIDKSSMYYIDKIYWLTEDCKKYGTYPFAGLARCAFISTDIINSFVRDRIMTNNDKNNFFQSIKTIATDINKDYKLPKNEFLKKYGHLRPNTYEISSLNYRDGYELYFKKDRSVSKDNIVKKRFEFNKVQKNKINLFLKKNKLNVSLKKFIFFLKESIKLREYSKYIFTKNIDMIFKYLKIFTKKFNLKVEDLSYLKIGKILDMYYNLSIYKIKGNLNNYGIENHIYHNKKEYKFNYPIKLPEVITSIKDLYYTKNSSKINFIGSKKTFGEILYLDVIKENAYNKKIVCIENADPGFDFIFTKKINGLITKYGGINSHMAIRCAELNLPAAIGVGNDLFNQIIKSNKLLLDCEQKKIIVNVGKN